MEQLFFQIRKNQKLIITTNENSISKIELYDVMGRMVLSAINVSEIDVREVEAGTYALRIYLNEGIETKKVIINR